MIPSDSELFTHQFSLFRVLLLLFLVNDPDGQGVHLDGTSFLIESNPPMTWDAFSDAAKWTIFGQTFFLEFRKRDRICYLAQRAVTD